MTRFVSDLPIVARIIQRFSIPITFRSHYSGKFCSEELPKLPVAVVKATANVLQNPLRGGRITAARLRQKSLATDENRSVDVDVDAGRNAARVYRHPVQRADYERVPNRRRKVFIIPIFPTIKVTPSKSVGMLDLGICSKGNTFASSSQNFILFSS